MKQCLWRKTKTGLLRVLWFDVAEVVDFVYVIDT